MCSKRFVFILVSFFLVSSLLLGQSLPSPANMTQAQIVAELMSNLTKREASITQQEAQLQKDQEALTRDRKVLMQDQEIFESRKALQIETESYWKSYKKETLKDKIITFAGGFAAGFAAGNYSGFRLGVTVKY